MTGYPWPIGHRHQFRPDTQGRCHGCGSTDPVGHIDPTSPSRGTVPHVYTDMGGRCVCGLDRFTGAHVADPDRCQVHQLALNADGTCQGCQEGWS